MPNEANWASLKDIPSRPKWLRSPHYLHGKGVLSEFKGALYLYPMYSLPCLHLCSLLYLRSLKREFISQVLSEKRYL